MLLTRLVLLKLYCSLKELNVRLQPLFMLQNMGLQPLLLQALVEVLLTISILPPPPTMFAAGLAQRGEAKSP